MDKINPTDKIDFSILKVKSYKFLVVSGLGYCVVVFRLFGEQLVMSF